MRRLLAVTLLMFVVTAASAQTDGGSGKAVCGLGVADFPGVGALKPGLPPEQVLALFPGSGEDVEGASG